MVHEDAKATREYDHGHPEEEVVIVVEETQANGPGPRVVIAPRAPRHVVGRRVAEPPLLVLMQSDGLVTLANLPLQVLRNPQ